MGIHDLAAKTRCNESVYAVALESGISEYSLNSTDYITINTALYYSGTTIYKGLKRGNPQSTGHVSSPKEPMFWYQTGNRIGFYPIPTASISGCSVFVYLTERLSSIAPTDTIPTPAIYDNALVYFVVAQGAYRDVQKTMGDAYMVMYHDILKLFRGDFEERPVEAPKEIIK
uniref:Uncharacterized protein n=1 Tax=viral metagenome TaxID=1070528 RepID=A0A6M3IFN7_9ZZZZ